MTLFCLRKRLSLAFAIRLDKANSPLHQDAGRSGDEARHTGLSCTHDILACIGACTGVSTRSGKLSGRKPLCCMRIGLCPRYLRLLSAFDVKIKMPVVLRILTERLTHTITCRLHLNAIDKRDRHDVHQHQSGNQECCRHHTTVCSLAPTPVAESYAVRR